MSMTDNVLTVDGDINSPSPGVSAGERTRGIVLKNLYAVLAVALFIKLTLIVHTHVRTYAHTHIYNL